MVVERQEHLPRVWGLGFGVWGSIFPTDLWVRDRELVVGVQFVLRGLGLGGRDSHHLGFREAHVLADSGSARGRQT